MIFTTYFMYAFANNFTSPQESIPSPTKTVNLIRAGELRGVDAISWQWNKEHVRFVHQKLDIDLTKLLSERLKNANMVLPPQVVRIDRFPTTSRSYTSFFWAWHGSDCNGLKDKIWKQSNGAVLSKVVSEEVSRLQAFGILKNGGVAIDIGAHTGDSTLPIALLANQTISFDPSVFVFPILKTNAAINANLHIDTYNLGISQKHGFINFEYSEHGEECNGGVAAVGGRDNKKAWRQRETVNLKNFLERRYSASVIASIQYIKIDCEGYDSSILTSLGPLVQGLNPKPIIQVEYFDAFHRQDAAAGQLSEPSLALLSSIRSLPGNYRLFCTKQCNTPSYCDLNATVSFEIK